MPDRVRNIGNELFYGKDSKMNKNTTQNQVQERKSIVADDIIIEEFEVAEQDAN